MTAWLGALAGCGSYLECPQTPVYAVSVEFWHLAGDSLLTGPTPGRIVEGAYTDSLHVEWLDDQQRVASRGQRQAGRALHRASGGRLVGQ